jgi:hypothetical protein
VSSAMQSVATDTVSSHDDRLARMMASQCFLFLWDRQRAGGGGYNQYSQAR